MTFVQPGFFDLQDRYEQLSAAGDPLERLNAIIPWTKFRPTLNRLMKKARKSNAGRPPYDYVLMFKILVLQSLYNLSDHQTEYQIRDRLSFMRFLGLGLENNVPDEKTLWEFRERLVAKNGIEKLFRKFDKYLRAEGYDAQCGTMVDASIVPVPKQRNTKEVNQEIKAGEIPACIENKPNVKRHKDLEARWTVKNGQYHYGYKDHVNADTKHKFIRRYAVTTASVGDISCLEGLLYKNNSDNKLWADSAYHSEEMEKMLKKKGYASRIIIPNKAKYPEWSDQERENKRRAKIRKRVEHIFGFMENSMNRMFVRTIGLARAKTKIGLMNLVYNFCRFEQLERLATG
jgi:IS5 family transposase